MKICSKCNEEKQEVEFNFKNKKLNKLHSNCKTCQKIMKDKHYNENKKIYLDRNNQRRQKLREDFIEFKKTLSCTKCGENHPACLDFHHENDDKEYNVSSMIWSHSRKKIQKEIDKCLVLCSNCHRKHHYQAGIV